VPVVIERIGSHVDQDLGRKRVLVGRSVVVLTDLALNATADGENLNVSILGARGLLVGVITRAYDWRGTV